jgi:aspartyl protease family protein
MIRFDLQSAIVMAAATASSLSVAFWLTHVDGLRHEARAETVIAAPMISGPVTASVQTGQKSGAAQITRSADGHYWAEANIDGRAVRVLVDTGASVVALTRDDALRLGLKLTPADFNRSVQTASGPARAAAVTLGSVAVAGAEVRGVQALVVEQGLGQSLLGMSYLGRLSAFEATPAALTLRP